MSFTKYVTLFAKEGYAINRHIIKPVAYGVIKYHIPSCYDTIEWMCGWTECLMERMNLVKQKGGRQNR